MTKTHIVVRQECLTSPITKVLITILVATPLLWMGCSTNEGTGVGPNIQYSGTQFEGERTTDFLLSESPYWITGDVIIPAYASVNIPPGCELRFGMNESSEAELSKFVVKGHLNAVGTYEQNIIFTSMQGAYDMGDYGQWRAIVFDDAQDSSVNAADSSRLEFCIVRYGAVWDSTERYPEGSLGPDRAGIWLNAGVLCYGSSPVIRNCTIVKNQYHGILCYGPDAEPLIINSNIYENDGDGIRCESPNGLALPQPNIWFNNCKQNSGRQYGDTPGGVGNIDRLNINRDSCDVNFNMRIEPLFNGFEDQDYSLHPCSPCINAGQDEQTIGSVPYYVAPNELRGLLQLTDAGGDGILDAGDYRVTCNLLIEEGISLVIEPNVTLRFEGLYQIRMAGLLQADGAAFVPDEDVNAANKWKGIMFVQGAQDASYIRNCSFVNASTTITSDPYGGTIVLTGGAVTLFGVSPEIYHNTFSNSEYAAISCLNSAQPQISYNVVNGFSVAAIYCYNNSHPLIQNNIISGGSGNGIWCRQSSPEILENVIHSVSVNGIECYNTSSPTINYTTISNCGYSGVLSSLGSSPLIKNSIIAFNGGPATWANSSYGHGVRSADNTSDPQIQFCDVYQPDGQGSIYGGTFGGSASPDTVNCMSLDPLFADTTTYTLSPSSPCLSASSEGKDLGAYPEGTW